MSTRILDLDAPKLEVQPERGFELDMEAKRIRISYPDGKMWVEDVGETGLTAGNITITGSADGDFLFVSDGARTYCMVTSLTVMREVVDAVGGLIGMPPDSPERGQTYAVLVREVLHMPESHDEDQGTMALDAYAALEAERARQAEFETVAIEVPTEAAVDPLRGVVNSSQEAATVILEAPEDAEYDRSENETLAVELPQEWGVDPSPKNHRRAVAIAVATLLGSALSIALLANKNGCTPNGKTAAEESAVRP